MGLIDNRKKEENSKDKILLVAIIILILLSLTIIGFMIVLLGTSQKTNTSKINIDWEQDTVLTEKLIQDNQIKYIPIKYLANVVGYEAFNGDYIYVSEDINKCHVIIKNQEVIQFYNNSKEVNKIKYGENKEYSKLELTNPIISNNEELYISIDDISNALYLYCDTSDLSNIQILSLSSLYDIYNNYVIELGYKGIVNNIISQKAILYDRLICQNNKDKYGVIDSKGKVIIEAKYDNIQFVEETGDFIVTYNGSKGVIYNQQLKINILYDEIEYINYANVYAVTSNKKISIFDENGMQITGFNFDQIGSKTRS